MPDKTEELSTTEEPHHVSRNEWLVRGIVSTQGLTTGSLNMGLFMYLRSLGFDPLEIGLFMSLALLGNWLLFYYHPLVAKELSYRSCNLLSAIIHIVGAFIFSLTENKIAVVLAAMLEIFSWSNHGGFMRTVGLNAVGSHTPPAHQFLEQAHLSILVISGTCMAALAVAIMLGVPENLKASPRYDYLFTTLLALGGLELVLSCLLGAPEFQEEQPTEKMDTGETQDQSETYSPALLFCICLGLALHAVGESIVSNPWKIDYAIHDLKVDPVELGVLFVIVGSTDVMSSLLFAYFSMLLGPIKSYIFLESIALLLYIGVGLSNDKWSKNWLTMSLMLTSRSFLFPGYALSAMATKSKRYIYRRRIRILVSFGFFLGTSITGLTVYVGSYRYTYILSALCLGGGSLMVLMQCLPIDRMVPNKLRGSY